VAQRPNQRRAIVRGKRRILGGVVVDDLGQVGAGNGRVGIRSFCLRLLLVLLIAPYVRRQEAIILLPPQTRQQCLINAFHFWRLPDSRARRT
jgi:hypothetical protein